MVVTRPGSRKSFTLEIESIHVRLVMAVSNKPAQVQRVWALEPRVLGILLGVVPDDGKSCTPLKLKHGRARDRDDTMDGIMLGKLIRLLHVERERQPGPVWEGVTTWSLQMTTNQSHRDLQMIR
jgi:hypothetical protein